MFAAKLTGPRALLTSFLEDGINVTEGWGLVGLASCKGVVDTEIVHERNQCFSSILCVGQLYLEVRGKESKKKEYERKRRVIGERGERK